VINQAQVQAVFELLSKRAGGSVATGEAEGTGGSNGLQAPDSFNKYLR